MAEITTTPHPPTPTLQDQNLHCKAEQHWGPNPGWDCGLLEDLQPESTFQNPDYYQLGQGTDRLKTTAKDEKAFLQSS